MSTVIPRYEDVYGSPFFSPVDFNNGQTIRLKIISTSVDELTCVKGNKAVKNLKCVLTCQGEKKKIAVNKTSAKRLAAKWGKEFSGWHGKTIIVGAGEVNGKPATLLTPVDDADRAEPVDELSIPEENIPPNYVDMVVTHVAVKTGTQKSSGKPWTAFSIKFPDDRWASTFDAGIGAQLEQAKAARSECRIVWEPAKSGTTLNIVSVMPL